MKPTPFIRGRAEFLNFGRQTKTTRITSHGHIRHSIRTFLGLYLTPRNQRQGIVEAEKGEDHECQTCPNHLKKVLLARRLSAGIPCLSVLQNLFNHFERLCASAMFESKLSISVI